MKIISIGWDVRGWRGTQQAVAVLEISDNQIEWSISRDFQFEANIPLSLSSLLEPALGVNYQAYISDADKIIIGIDAPLAFSKAFLHMLNDET